MSNDRSDYLQRFNRKLRRDGPYSALGATLRHLKRRFLSLYVSTKETGVEWQRYINYRVKYGSSTPKPSDIIYVNPGSVLLTLPRRVVPESSHPFENWDDQNSYYGIIGGDWDCHAIPFTQSVHFRGIYERFVEQKEWKHTSEYTYHKERGWSENKVQRHFDEVEQLYNSIKANGYDFKYPVTLHITRDGDFIRRDGYHRISIANILNIEKIPAKIKLRHAKWQAVREEIYHTNTKTKLSQKAQANLTHPDIKND